MIDLQPANILFSVDSDLSGDILLEPEFSPVNWLSGVEVDNSAPLYLMSSQRPRGMLDNAIVSTLTVKIGDMGGGQTPLGGARIWIIDRYNSYVEWQVRFSSSYANCVEST